MNPSTSCKDCKQLHEYYHRKVYGYYLKKKLFFKHKGVSTQPEFQVILEEYKDAHNETRRVNYHCQFNFYNGSNQDLPLCANEAIHMMEEIVAGAKLNDET